MAVIEALRIAAIVIGVIVGGVLLYIMITNCGCLTIILALIAIFWIFMMWMKERKGG